MDIWGKSVPGRGNGQCKGPELECVWLVQGTVRHLWERESRRN